MKVIILDTKTGKTGELEGPTAYDFCDGNYACDCNRDIFRASDAAQGNTCAGCKRFLVVGFTLDAGELGTYSLADFNSNYPTELLVKHGVVAEQATPTEAVPQPCSAALAAWLHDYFRALRFNPQHHLGTRDIRLTADQVGALMIEAADEISKLTAHIPAAGAWRNPITDPPTKTGQILVWIRGAGPGIVNVEEEWMSYSDGNGETEPACPDEWTGWSEVNEPK